MQFDPKNHKAPFLSLALAFACLFCANNAGIGQENKKGNWPKELEGISQQYKSPELRKLIDESFESLKNQTKPGVYEAVNTLMDLNNPEISLWVLKQDKHA